MPLGVRFEKFCCYPATTVVINRSCNWRFNSSLGACIMGEARGRCILDDLNRKTLFTVTPLSNPLCSQSFIYVLRTMLFFQHLRVISIISFSILHSFYRVFQSCFGERIHVNIRNGKIAEISDFSLLLSLSYFFSFLYVSFALLSLYLVQRTCNR